jgi:pimeloyl-ACP methyl ester carboxylesterase
LRARAKALSERLADEPRPRVLLGHGVAGAAVLEIAVYNPGALEGLVAHAPLLHPWRARLGLPDRATLRWLASLPPVGAPAAVLWGERDPTFTTARLAALRRVLPGAIFSLPGRWGRRPMIDDPAGYAREVAALARKLVAR